MLGISQSKHLIHIRYWSDLLNIIILHDLKTYLGTHLIFPLQLYEAGKDHLGAAVNQGSLPTIS